MRKNTVLGCVDETELREGTQCWGVWMRPNYEKEHSAGVCG